MTVDSAVSGAIRGYDRLIDGWPGYHDHLALSARRMGLPDEGRGLRLLDLGCGTGASTAALVRAAPRAKIVAVDSSAEMLGRAREKAWTGRVRFVRGPIEQLADAGVTGLFDGVFAAHVMSGLPDLDAGLQTILRVLRPGAPLAVHDRSVAGSVRSRVVWFVLSRGLLIPLGTLITGRTGFYRALAEDARRFDSPTQLEQRLAGAGFVDLRTQTVPGWEQRIVHTWLARRLAG